VKTQRAARPEVHEHALVRRALPAEVECASMVSQHGESTVQVSQHQLQSVAALRCALTNLEPAEVVVEALARDVSLARPLRVVLGAGRRAMPLVQHAVCVALQR
jgi:hypothetical protein